jgi:hypothetical protein
MPRRRNDNYRSVQIDSKWVREHISPVYDITSPTLQRFRQKARNGLADLSREEIVKYAEAVERAILAKQRSALRRSSEPEHRCNCASRTWHNDADAIHRAILAQQRAALNAAAERDRHGRSDATILELYTEAMAAKRKRSCMVAA